MVTATTVKGGQNEALCPGVGSMAGKARVGVVGVLLSATSVGKQRPTAVPPYSLLSWVYKERHDATPTLARRKLSRYLSFYTLLVGSCSGVIMAQTVKLA